MNVAIAAMSAPTQMNGVSRHAANLVRALLSTTAISEVHFLAGAWQRKMFRNALCCADPRLHTHWIPLREANLSRLFWYYRELPCIAAQLETDVVHFTFPAPKAPAAFPCPTVLSLHDLYPFAIPRNFGMLKSLLARHTIAQCIRRVDAVACVSSTTRADFIRRFPAQAYKARVIHNIVEFRGPAMMTGNLQPLKSRRFILCVAQHRSNKNIPLAVSVFERLLTSRIFAAEARLVVVGIPGPETRKIEEMIRNARLSHKVLMFSGLSDAELRWCYQNCDLLLAPSSQEGFGLPVAEALLAGARVVCSDISAFRELGGESCRYVSWTGDPVTAYVSAVRDALAAVPARTPSLLHLSASSIGEQYAHLYSELAGSPAIGFEQAGSIPRMRQTPSGLRLR
jgi:glycosyltransferase involved in cell wall biosynthesis